MRLFVRCARNWPKLLCLLVSLFGASETIAADDDVIELRPASTAPNSPSVSRKIPSLELAEASHDAPGLTVTTPGSTTILNIPEVFSDGALGGVEAEALVIGPPGRWTPRVGTKYLTEGVGYDDPFLFLSGVVPWRVRHGKEHEVDFIEVTGGVSRHSDFTGSVEWVSREYEDGGKRVKGDYWAFDYRDTDVGSYRQLAFGCDSLGVNRESRYNVYIPLGRNQKFIAQQQINVPFGTALVPALQKNFETAMYGGDVEYGWRIVPLDQSSIWGLVGGYHFQAGGVPQVWGVKARAELRLWDVARISIEYQHDQVFRSNVVLSGEILFPGYKPRGRTDCYITDRLGESIQRWRTITLARTSVLDFF